MLLQIALDDISFEDAKVLLSKVEKYVDIIELGTPFAYSNPISAIGEFKKLFPNKKILADYKILDGGGFMANLAYNANADITTVSARAHDETIAGAICAAKAHKREILVDMMAVPLNEIADRTRIAAQLGADYVCVHTSLDVKDAVDPFRSIEAARQGSDNIHIAVAGGINLKTIRSLVAVKPDVIIVGGALVKAADPVTVAAELRMQMGG